MKNLIKDKSRLTYGFDVEKLKVGTKIEKISYNGVKEYLWVQKCTPEMLWLEDKDGICHYDDFFSVEEYNLNNFSLNIVK